MLWDTNWKNELNAYQGFNWPDFYIPLVRYTGRKKVLQEIWNITTHPHQEPSRVRGFKAIDEDWNTDLQNARAALKNGIKAKIDPEITTLLDQFLTQCKSENIQVILVFSPEYIAGQKFVKNRKDVFAIFDKMAKKHALPYLNYSHHEICTQQDLFFNSNHLNNKGVIKFNQALREDLAKIRE